MARTASRAEQAGHAARPGDSGRRGQVRPRDVADGNSESAPVAQEGGQPGDPVTLAVIEQELRDFPPDERLLIAAELKGLSPENARMVLKTYRMMNRYRQELPETAAARPGAADGGTQGGAGDATTSARRALPLGGAFPSDPSRPGVGSAELPFERAGRDSRAAYDESFFTEAAIARDASQAGAPPLAAGAAGAIQQTGGVQTRPATGAVQLANAPRKELASDAISAGGAAASRTLDAARIESATAGGDPLTDLIAATETEAFRLSPGESDAERLQYIEKHVHLRMLYLLAGQQERALTAIPGIDAPDQEFWQQTFWALANYFDASSMPRAADRASQTIAQLGNAQGRLQRKAHLELRNVNFCHKIGGFGNYEKYPRDEFAPGQEVYLYAELANTSSEPAPEGLFRTSHKSTLEIYRHGASAELLERIELPETTDLCRVQRRDYFHSYYVTIPAKLSAGPHILKLTVEDLVNRRIATSSVNFLVK
jgi:hypothetical protein